MKRRLRILRIIIKGRYKLLYRISIWQEGREFYFAYYGKNPENIDNIIIFYHHRYKEVENELYGNITEA